MKTNIKLIGSVIVFSFSMVIFQTCFAETGKNFVETNNSKVIPGVPVKQAEAVLQGKQDAVDMKQDMEDNRSGRLIEPPEILYPAPMVKKDPTIPWIIPVPVPDKKLLSDVLSALDISQKVTPVCTIDVPQKAIIDPPIPESTISENQGIKITPPKPNTLKPPTPPKLVIEKLPSFVSHFHATKLTRPDNMPYNDRLLFGASFLCYTNLTIEETMEG